MYSFLPNLLHRDRSFTVFSDRLLRASRICMRDDPVSALRLSIVLILVYHPLAPPDSGLCTVPLPTQLFTISYPNLQLLNTLTGTMFASRKRARDDEEDDNQDYAHVNKVDGDPPLSYTKVLIIYIATHASLPNLPYIKIRQRLLSCITNQASTTLHSNGYTSRLFGRRDLATLHIFPIMLPTIRSARSA